MSLQIPDVWGEHEARYHRGLGLLTPSGVQHGLGEERRNQRSRVFAAAYAAYPEQFVRGFL